MDDFSIKAGVPNAYGLIGEDANAIAPGRRPLSSMTPSILIGSNRVAALGSPGGSRIITTVLLGILALIDGDDAQAASSPPYLPDEISAESNASILKRLPLWKQKVILSTCVRSYGNALVIWDPTRGEVQVGKDFRWQGIISKGAVGEHENR